jgi:hypothetical protein
MLEVAANLDGLTLLLAVLAAVLSMRATFLDYAFARRVSALGGFGHADLLTGMLRPPESGMSAF